jgi:hypothetical protein
MARKILADKLTISKDGKTIIATHDLTFSGGCQIGGTIGPDGKLTDLHCENDSCSGECQLREDGDDHWCSCVVQTER